MSTLQKLLPDRGPPSFAPPRRHLQRAVAATVIARAGAPHVSAEDVLRDRHGNDEASLVLIQRAASAPASTTASGWAAPLARQATADFVLTLPTSAASRLLAASLTLDFGGSNTISVPRLSGSLPTATFIDEANPSPVVQVVLASTALTPSKLLISAAFTGELARHSAAEAVITQILQEATAASLDSAIFSTTAGSAIRPAGLLSGVTGATPTAGGNYEAMITDLQGIIGTVAAAGGVEIAIVAGATAGAAIRLRAPDFPYPLWISRAIASDTAIAIDAASFVSGFGSEPRIDTSTEAVIHFEDQSPLPMGDAGVVATPSRSAFQADFVVLRLILDTAWAMREAGRVAFVAATTWS